jgi:signal peptidase II
VTATRRVVAYVYIAAAVAYALDRATKIWAEHALAGRDPIVLIPGVLDLDHTTNSGGAFGLGQSAPWLFAAASIGVSVAIVVASLRIEHVGTAIALGLVLGGALGNLTDRIVQSQGGPLTGRVVDFIDVHVWPVFNLADSAIVIGAVLLAVLSGRRDRRED